MHLPTYFRGFQGLWKTIYGSNFRGLQVWNSLVWISLITFTNPEDFKFCSKISPNHPEKLKKKNPNEPRPHSIPIQTESLGWEQASKFVLNIPGDSKAQLSLGTNSLVSLWHTVGLNAFCFFSYSSSQKQ